MGSAIALIGASKRSKVRFLKGHNADHDNRIGLLRTSIFTSIDIYSLYWFYQGLR